MINIELTKRVAELLGWTGIIPFDKEIKEWWGRPPTGTPIFIPSFATDLNACEAIWRDERVVDVEVFLRGPLSITLWRLKYKPFTISHNGTAAGIARAICEAFIELCEKEKGK